MVFAILLLLLLAAIVFFHYMQGFLSATLSAIFAVIAAVFAVSYHETVVESLLGGRLANEAHAMALLGLFIIIYLALRIIFDSAVPGNIRLPLAVEKGGAVVMGLIAGIFAVGIVAIAAQELPFGVSIAGYTRYDVQNERSVVVPTSGRSVDSKVFNELSASAPATFGDSGHGMPIIALDNIVVGMVEHLSSPDGTLDSGKPITDVHPDFLDELFGQRLGIETGAQRVALSQQVHVVGLYQLNSNVEEADSQVPALRNGGALKPIKPDSKHMFLVVRTQIAPSAADEDGLFRFSTGAVRLVAPSGEQGQFQDYYPVGTLDNANKLFLDKLDDYLFINLKASGQGGADFVFVVSKDMFEKQAPGGTFIEVKRMGRVDLSGQKVDPQITPSDTINVVRNPVIVPPKEPGAQGEAQPQPAAQPAPTPGRGRVPPASGRPGRPAMQRQPQPQQAAPQSSAQGGAFQVSNATVSASLTVAIKPPPGAPTGETAQVPGGTAIIDNGSVKNADVDAPAQQLGGTSQLALPQGQKAVQISGTPSASAPWAPVSDTEQYELVDSTGAHYQPNGVLVQYQGNGGARVLLRYINATTISGKPPQEQGGKPAQVTLIYLVPDGTTITAFNDHGQKVKDVSLTAK